MIDDNKPETHSLISYAESVNNQIISLHKRLTKLERLIVPLAERVARLEDEKEEK